MNTKNTQQIMKTVIAVLDLLKNCFSIKEVLFPATQGPGKQPAHLPLPLLWSKVEEELSSSAPTRTLLPALAES